MKKIVAVLLCAALLATCAMAVAESNSAAPADYAEEIWYTMAETGHADKNVMWRLIAQRMERPCRVGLAGGSIRKMRKMLRSIFTP